MLLDDSFPKEDDAEAVQIDTYRSERMVLDSLPGGFHVGGIGHLAHADARALRRGLHDERQAELGGDLVREFRALPGTGRGVAQDYVEAYKWYNLVGAFGYQRAVEARDKVMRLMSPWQITEGQKRASEAYKLVRQKLAAGIPLLVLGKFGDQYLLPRPRHR